MDYTLSLFINFRLLCLLGHFISLYFFSPGRILPWHTHFITRYLAFVLVRVDFRINLNRFVDWITKFRLKFRDIFIFILFLLVSMIWLWSSCKSCSIHLILVISFCWGRRRWGGFMNRTTITVFILLIVVIHHSLTNSQLFCPGLRVKLRWVLILIMTFSWTQM